MGSSSCEGVVDPATTAAAGVGGSVTAPVELLRLPRTDGSTDGNAVVDVDADESVA
jgi:hypothetical protein